jgi:hypothetical protein
MTKSELVSYVRRTILGSEAVADNQKTAHFQRVAQAVNYAISNLLSQVVLDDKGKRNIETYFVKHYYNQAVKESNGYRYFGVSDDIVEIGDGKGIWYVQPSKGEGKAGKPLAQMNRPSIASINNLPLGEVMNDTVWRFGNITTNRQIVLEDIGDSPYTDIRKVDFGVVRSFSAYADTEQVNIPDGRADLLIEMCREWMSVNYQDMVNNNQ